MAASVPTYSLDTRHTGVIGKRGFPLHYTDDRGLQLKLCETGDVRCQGADRSDLKPPNGEGFYWAASTTVRSSLGPIDVDFALEAAFAGRRPVVFDRLRIRGHLRQAGRYTLDHPYGSTTFRAISPQEQRNVNVTLDRPCSVKRKGRCNERITNFLRSTKNPPKGFIGFGGRRTPVTGGTVRNDLVLRDSGGNVIGTQSNFSILGDRSGRLR